jgi:hydrogenase maturation protease
MAILVLGIGQPLRGDDAAGVEIVRAWQDQYVESASRVQVEYRELPGLQILDLLVEHDPVVLVDAVHSREQPGTILRLTQDDIASFDTGSKSAHGWGIAESLSLGRSLDDRIAQCQIVLIGVVGKDFEMGVGLSRPVREAIPRAVDVIEGEVIRALFRAGMT